MMSLQGRFVQAMVAVEQADVIIFVLDGRTGLTGTDEEIATFCGKAKTSDSL